MARCGCSSTCMCTVHGDGQGIRVLGAGSQSSPYIISPIIDPTAGNLLSTTATGLRVDSESFPIVISDTTSVNLGGDGTVGTPLTATVKIDPAPGNAVSIGASGLIADLRGIALLTPVIRSAPDNAAWGESIWADASITGTFGINLPDPAELPGGLIQVTRVDAFVGRYVRVQCTHGETIEGDTHIDLTGQWNKLFLVNTGLRWHKLGSNV